VTKLSTTRLIENGRDKGLERPSPNELSCRDGEIDLVVRELKGICRNSNLEFALHVGRLIIHRFHDGNMNDWRSRGAKTTSFRQLSAHPELPMSAVVLYRCVALFELCDRLDAPSRWRHLGVSHLRAVIGLPTEEQERILSAGNASRWSVQEMDAEARKFRQAHVSSRGGRHRGSTLLKALKSIQRTMQDWGRLADDQLDVNAEERSQSVMMIRNAQCCLSQISERLGDAGAEQEAKGRMG
jgi:hypothetical protein